MRAIVQDRYGSADVLRLADIDAPVPGPGEVVVRVHAAGVDAGVWHLMTGLPYLVRLVGFGMRRPKNPVPGMDLAGRIETVGPDVTDLRPDDEVFGVGRGTFAELALARTDKLAPKPANMDFVHAAATPISGLTALQAVRDQGEVRRGQRVLVIGAGGGVGTFAVQIAKALGADVTGVCSTAKADLVRSIGAGRVIDHTREDFADGRATWDVIIDTGGRRPLGVLRRALAPEGTLVLVGGEGGDRWLGGFGRQLRAPFVSMLVRQRLRMLIGVERKEDLLALKGMIEAGQVTPVVDRTLPLAEAADAIRYMHDGHARGKVVVVVAP